MQLTNESVTLLVVIITVLSNGLGYLAKTLIDKRKSEDKTQEALKILLRRELATQHEFYIAQGTISRIGLQEFESTLEVYEGLIGSNGYVQDLADDIRNLKAR